MFEKARVLRRDWADCGKGAVVGDRGDREYAGLSAPEDLLVIAAGGPAGGFGAVIPPWYGQRRAKRGAPWPSGPASIATI